ncbi:MAG: hypothetical protein AAFR59_15250 [Bacteroidota bacterium]
MNISLESIVEHRPDVAWPKEESPEESLKAFCTRVLEERGCTSANVQCNDGKTIEVTDAPSSAVHGLVLAAEEQGLKVSFEKRVVIRISE